MINNTWRLVTFARLKSMEGWETGTGQPLVSRQICKVGISLADVEEGSVEKPNWDRHRIKIFDWFWV